MLNKRSIHVLMNSSKKFTRCVLDQCFLCCSAIWADVFFSFSVLRMSAKGRSYTQNFLKVQYIIIQAILDRKLMKKFTVTDEKYSVSIRLLTVKNNSHTDLKTFGAQLSENGCLYGEEDSEKNFVIRRIHYR